MSKAAHAIAWAVFLFPGDKELEVET